MCALCRSISSKRNQVTELIVHEHNANECLLYVSGANETMCYDPVCCCSVGGMERNALHARYNPRGDVIG